MTELLILVIVILIIWIVTYCITLDSIAKRFIGRIDRWLDIKHQDNVNKQYELFTNIDIPATKDLINDLVDDYISNYALYNFAISEKEYIGQEEAELMIKEVTKAIVVNMSDYYLFLFKIFRSITNDEDLVLAVRDIVKERALMYITESNKPT